MQQQFHLMKPTSILGFVPLLNIHATPNLYASNSNINIKEQVLILKGFETQCKNIIGTNVFVSQIKFCGVV